MTALDWFITVGSFGCFAAAWAWFCVEISRKISSGGPLSPSDSNSRPTPHEVKQSARSSGIPHISTSGGSRPGRISHSLAKWLAFHGGIK